LRGFLFVMFADVDVEEEVPLGPASALTCAARVAREAEAVWPEM
jgi:hypothetical protein